MILVAVNSVIILYKFIKFLNNYQLINDITAYLTFNTLIDIIIIMLINPIVWILFINAFIKNYIGYEINNDNHVNEDINSCNKSLNSVLTHFVILKFLIIIILTVLFGYGLFSLFVALYNLVHIIDTVILLDRTNSVSSSIMVFILTYLIPLITSVGYCLFLYQ